MTKADQRPELAGVAGVPETTLSDGLLARLPDEVPPAPWTCEAEAVVWYARGSAAATEALPPALRGSASGLAVVGGIVRYASTPVGPYDEVFALVGSRSRLQPWGSVAFMAVDSEASLRCRQQFPAGRLGDNAMNGRGRIRVAVVTVDVESDGALPTWLRPGRHLGAVVESATFTMTEPAFD